MMNNTCLSSLGAGSPHPCVLTVCCRYGVTVGAIIGHSICTGVAVVGGALLARRISQRTVAVAGGTLFLIFAALNLFSRD